MSTIALVVVWLSPRLMIMRLRVQISPAATVY